MQTIVTTITPDTTAETLVTEAAEGKVKFHRERSNGTFRRVQFLSGEQREVAEWVVLQREEGKTMKAIAAEMHVSVPTVRRLINSLLLTEEIEDLDTEEAADLVASAEYVEEGVQQAEAHANA